MRYRVIFYNRSTDFVEGLIDVPARCIGKVLAIAGIKDSGELGEYPLGQAEMRDIAALVGFEPDLSRFVYHLEPLGLDRSQLRA
jgi:hypothetical protein